MPDLYHAPLYPIAIAVGLLLIPETLEVGLWKDAIFVGDVKPTGFNADYLLLIVNLIFFWLGCFLVYVLGKRLFSPRVGLVSLFGVFLSVGIWDQVLAISGMSILLFLVVGLFLLWEHLERIRISIDDSPKSLQAMVFSTGVGLVAGLLFLTEYTACIVFLVYVGYTLLHFRRTALLVYLSAGYCWIPPRCLSMDCTKHLLDRPSCGTGWAKHRIESRRHDCGAGYV